MAEVETPHEATDPGVSPANGSGGHAAPAVVLTGADGRPVPPQGDPGRISIPLDWVIRWGPVLLAFMAGGGGGTALMETLGHAHEGGGASAEEVAVAVRHELEAHDLKHTQELASLQATLLAELKASEGRQALALREAILDERERGEGSGQRRRVPVEE